MPQIYSVLFIVADRAPLFRETLVKGLGTISCSQTLAKDLLRCKSACRLTPETQTKGEWRRERRRDRLEFRICGCSTVVS